MEARPDVDVQASRNRARRSGTALAGRTDAGRRAGSSTTKRAEAARANGSCPPMLVRGHRSQTRSWRSGGAHPTKCESASCSVGTSQAGARTARANCLVARSLRGSHRRLWREARDQWKRGSRVRRSRTGRGLEVEDIRGVRGTSRGAWRRVGVLVDTMTAPDSRRSRTRAGISYEGEASAAWPNARGSPTLARWSGALNSWEAHSAVDFDRWRPLYDIVPRSSTEADGTTRARSRVLRAPGDGCGVVGPVAYIEACEIVQAPALADPRTVHTVALRSCGSSEPARRPETAAREDLVASRGVRRPALLLRQVREGPGEATGGVRWRSCAASARRCCPSSTRASSQARRSSCDQNAASTASTRRGARFRHRTKRRPRPSARPPAPPERRVARRSARVPLVACRMLGIRARRR